MARPIAWTSNSLLLRVTLLLVVLPPWLPPSASSHPIAIAAAAAEEGQSNPKATETLQSDDEPDAGTDFESAAAAAAAPTTRTFCLTTREIGCLLSGLSPQNCTQSMTSSVLRTLVNDDEGNGNINRIKNSELTLPLLLGRVRLPKTASTLESDMLARYEGGFNTLKYGGANQAVRYQGLAKRVCGTSSRGDSADGATDSAQGGSSASVSPKTGGGELCFTVDTNKGLGGPSSSPYLLPFRPIRKGGLVMAHVSYDEVESELAAQVRSSLLSRTGGGASESGGGSVDGENDPEGDGDHITDDTDDTRSLLRNHGIILTSLRDPGSYAPSWYYNRDTSDMFTDMSNLTFAEWVEEAPWRMNVLTRVLGSSGADRRAMPTANLLYYGLDRDKLVAGLGGEDGVRALMEDKYMVEQNDLGPEGSEVYRRAVDRLRNDVTHFGMIHRLPESWRLMAHKFCWDMGGNGEEGEEFKQEKAKRGLDAILDSRHLKGLGRAEAGRIWTRLQERNRLDLAVMEEADKILDKRVAEMEAEKSGGVLCNFLGMVKVTCADIDMDMDAPQKDEL